MPKYVKSSEPDRILELGAIKLNRIGSTIYLYVKGFVHPVMTRKCGDDTTARDVFYRLKKGLLSIVWTGKSRWEKFKERIKI